MFSIREPKKICKPHFYRFNTLGPALYKNSEMYMYIRIGIFVVCSKIFFSRIWIFINKQLSVKNSNKQKNDRCECSLFGARAPRTKRERERQGEARASSSQCTRESVAARGSRLTIHLRAVASLARSFYFCEYAIARINYADKLSIKLRRAKLNVLIMKYRGICIYIR